MSRAGYRNSALALFLAGAALLTPGCAQRVSRPPGDPALVAEQFLEAWAQQDWERLESVVLAEPGTKVAAGHQKFRESLRLESSRFELVRVHAVGPRGAAAEFRSTHVLRGLGEWSHDGQLPLEYQPSGWKVRWSPAVLHPAASEGDVFSRTRTWPRRGALRAADGAPLTREGEVVQVGVDVRRVQDRAVLAQALASELGVDATRFHARVDSASRQESPPSFLPIIDLRPERYRQVRPLLAPLPGIFFRKKVARLTLEEGFAAQTLGRTGEVTAELLQQLGAPYQAGDLVGLSGLERAYERRLAGKPFGEILLTASNGASRVLDRIQGERGEDVETTLRSAVQLAADAALEGVRSPAALVAVDTRSGAILAVASRPLGQPYNRALAGRYPPGSTFKVVTAEALLAAGMTPESLVQCPPEARVGGKAFRNFEGEQLGTATFRTAFAHSCNTAIVSLHGRIGASGIRAAARRFGFDVSYDIGLSSYGGSFPEPKDLAELAAALIGQGRVLASPLHMASVAAAAASGKWRAPYLVESHKEGPEHALASGADGPLRTLMRAVVTEGTGRQGAHLSGLAGKTGTAEFGTTVPPPTHAWFIGHRGEVAFSVLVEGGGVGGRVAMPIAARFAAALEAP